MTAHGIDCLGPRGKEVRKGKKQDGIELEGVYHVQKHVTYPDKDVVMSTHALENLLFYT